jgi:hypothetical protein
MLESDLPRCSKASLFPRKTATGVTLSGGNCFAKGLDTAHAGVALPRPCSCGEGGGGGGGNRWE